MSIFEILKKTFRKKSETQKTSVMPDAGQTWLLPDKNLDPYCTPIIIHVVKVVNGSVFYYSNYLKKTVEKTVEDFQKDYQFHI